MAVAAEVAVLGVLRRRGWLRRCCERDCRKKVTAPQLSLGSWRYVRCSKRPGPVWPTTAEPPPTKGHPVTYHMYTCVRIAGGHVEMHAVEMNKCCHPKPGVAGRHQAETAPYRTHLAGTAPCRRAAGRRARKLHTAGSGRVTAQEELGNGYIRGKLLPLVDKK